MDQYARKQVGETLSTAVEDLGTMPFNRQSIEILSRCAQIQTFFKHDKATPLASQVYREMADDLNKFSAAVSGQVNPDTQSALRQVAELFLAESQKADVVPSGFGTMFPEVFLGGVTMPPVPFEAD
jgi:hypothetical protein